MCFLVSKDMKLSGLCMKDTRISLTFVIIFLTSSIETRKCLERWGRLFLRIHPDISARSPGHLPSSCRRFNRVAVTHILLTGCSDNHKFTVDKIFNYDETGITVNPKGNSKIIAPQGKRKV